MAALAILFARRVIGQLLRTGADIPRLYPAPEGGVSAEWTHGSHEVSLEISSAGEGWIHVLDIAAKDASGRIAGTDEEAVAALARERGPGGPVPRVIQEA